MTKVGSTLRLVFQDNWGTVLYTEPITFSENIEYSLDKYLDAFRRGILDVLDDLRRDMKHEEEIRYIPTHILEKELARRYGNK